MEAWGRGKVRHPSVFGNVNAGNFARFEDDGMLVFNGTATTWRDFNFAAVALGAAASAPDLIQVRGSMQSIDARCLCGDLMEQ